MDRLVWLLCTFGVIYASETTLGTNSTLATTIVSESTELPEAMVTSPIRTDERNIVTTTEVPLANEIMVEERATVQAVRSTEPPLQEIKEQSTAKQGLTTAVLKEHSIRDEGYTTKVPPQLLITERSPLTTEAREVSSPLSIQHHTQTSTTPSSQRPSQTTSNTPPTTNGQAEQMKKKMTTHHRPTQPSTVRLEATTQPLPPLPLNKPKRKVAASSVQAKKGTVNAGPMQQSKKRRQSSKKDNGMSSLLYIPLMIQAQMMPMMIMQLKFFALKALALGKLALIILGFNLLRNAIIGYNNDAQQYEHESLASAHYGYNGGPEYGSWVNRRMYKSEPEIKQISDNFESRVNRNHPRINKLENTEFFVSESNSPYKAYKHQAFEKTIPRNR